MTTQERDQLARDIYEGRYAVYFAGVYKRWEQLQACERGPWLIAAELKPEYFRVACRNLARVEAAKELPLFAALSAD